MAHMFSLKRMTRFVLQFPWLLTLVDVARQKHSPCGWCALSRRLSCAMPLTRRKPQFVTKHLGQSETRNGSSRVLYKQCMRMMNHNEEW